MSVNIFIVANVTNNGQPSNYRTVCRVLAIAALLQGWLLCGGFCVPCKCAAMCGGWLGCLHWMSWNLKVDGMFK